MVGKGENAGNQHFLLAFSPFPTMFSILTKKITSATFYLLSANTYNLAQSMILSFSKKLSTQILLL